MITGYGAPEYDVEAFADQLGVVEDEQRSAVLPLRPGAPGPLRSRLLTVSQLRQLPPVEPLVEGLLYRGTLAQLSGSPGTYKSFLTLGMALCVALGLTFEGHRVPTAGPVVYVAPEGATGLQARILAWCELAGVDPALLDGRFYVLPVPVQLGRAVDVSEALDMVRELRALLLVLDTRARCTVGLEENSATEQGRAIAAVEGICAETGCTVLAVHHSGRNGAAGRGSTAWDGAIWSDLRVEGASLGATITCAKHKDVPDGCEHAFRMVPHTVSGELMPDATGAQRQTLVAVRADERDWGRPGGVQDAAGPIVQAVVRECAGPNGLTRAQIRELVQERGASRSAAYSAMNRLVRGGVLVELKGDRLALSPTYAHE